MKLAIVNLELGVPKGTVTALTISPRDEMRPSVFGLDLSKYKKREGGDIVGLEHYDSEDEGVSVDLYRGFFQNLFLYAPQEPGRVAV